MSLSTTFSVNKVPFVSKAITETSGISDKSFINSDSGWYNNGSPCVPIWASISLIPLCFTSSLKH